MRRKVKGFFVCMLVATLLITYVPYQGFADTGTDLSEDLGLITENTNLYSVGDSSTDGMAVSESLDNAIAGEEDPDASLEADDPDASQEEDPDAALEAEDSDASLDEDPEASLDEVPDATLEADDPDASLGEDPDAILEAESSEEHQEIAALADPLQSVGVVLSNLVVTPLSNGKATVQYSITNNTAATLSKSNLIAYYKDSITKSNYLFNRSLQSDVAPGATVIMTDTLTYTRIANLALVLRLFDNGSSYPYVKPAAYTTGDTSETIVYRTYNPDETVSLSNFSVARSSKTKITITYTVTNNTNMPVLKGSYISVYKDSLDSANYLFHRNLIKDVPAGASITMSDTVSSIWTDIGSFPLVARLFDYGTASYPFPYQAPNVFFDGRTDNKTVYEAIDSSGSVALSDFSVKKVSENKVTFTYTITNNTSSTVSGNSSVAFYENSPERTNFLFTRKLQKDIAPWQSVVITDTVTHTGIYAMRIVARLFDNGTTFPYLYPNVLTDNDLTNKTVKAASFKTKVVCVGDSITYGYGVLKSYNYTAQLQKKLGDDYAIVNYGVSGRTANSKGDSPYVKEKDYQKALASEPDVVIIMLGSNDARTANRTPALLSSFKSEYTNLVLSFVNLPNKPKVYVVTPVAVIKANANISETVLSEQIRPQIREVATELGLPLIEFETLLSDNKAYYQSDGKHPTSKGYDVMSTAFYGVLTGA